MTTRRNVLRTAIAAAFAAPVSAAAICMAPGAPVAVSTASPDIRQLWERWSAAKASADEAEAILTDAVAFARAAWPVAPEELRYRSHGTRPECRVSFGYGVEDGKLQTYGVWDATHLMDDASEGLRRSYGRKVNQQVNLSIAYEAACEVVRERFDIYALVAAATDTAAAEKLALAALIGAPARSLPDVAMKADAMKSSGIGPLMLNAERLAADVLAIAGA